jgi:hypothetical protein
LANKQLTGYANAVKTIIPLDSTIAINFIQFSDGSVEELPFTVIDTQATADWFAAYILEVPHMKGWTNISSGIELGLSTLQLFDASNSYDKWIIDVSTDGQSYLPPPGPVDPLITAENVVNVGGVTAVNAIGIGPSAVLGFEYGTDGYCQIKSLIWTRICP